MTKLSINVNKIATLRNARGKNNPDVLQWVLKIISYGADGITVHPRPDGRHIRPEDVCQIAEAIQVELNVEGYPNKNFLALIEKVKPTQCTLVPDSPHVLTSNAGWLVEKNAVFLQDTISALHDYGVRTSLFIDPYTVSEQDIALLKVVGTDRVELYTEAYADAHGTAQEKQTLDQYVQVAYAINQLGIELNAGHDLDLLNLRAFLQAIPIVQEVSIGHALICDALQFGMKETIARYISCL